MSASDIKLYRKRYFPDEEVDISGDEILYLDDDLLVTKWQPINYRNDIGSGISFWYFNKNIKVSKLYDKELKFKSYYIDMCRYEIEKDVKYKIVDLLADVVVNPDMTYKVLDFDELTEYLEKEAITPKEFMQSIKAFTKVITDINDGVFPYVELDKYNI